MRNLNDFTIKSVLLRYNSVLKRLNILIFLLVVAAQSAMAQYDVEFSHYFDMEPYYNAAAVGKQDKLNIVGAYSMQFAGFEHNPRTMFISADAPFIFLNSYHGAGVQILNDKLGFFTHQRIAVQYALKRPLFGGTLSVGVQGGLILEGYDGSSAHHSAPRRTGRTEPVADRQNVLFDWWIQYSAKKSVFNYTDQCHRAL